MPNGPIHRTTQPYLQGAGRESMHQPAGTVCLARGCHGGLEPIQGDKPSHPPTTRTMRASAPPETMIYSPTEVDHRVCSLVVMCGWQEIDSGEAYHEIGRLASADRKSRLVSGALPSDCPANLPTLGVAVRGSPTIEQEASLHKRTAGHLLMRVGFWLTYLARRCPLLQHWWGADLVGRRLTSAGGHSNYTATVGLSIHYYKLLIGQLNDRHQGNKTRPDVTVIQVHISLVRDRSC